MAFVRPITCTFGDAGQEGAGSQAGMGYWLSANSRRKEACMDNFVMQSCVRESVCPSVCVFTVCILHIYVYTHVLYISSVCVGGEDHSCMNNIFNIFLKFSFVYYLSRTLFGGGNGNGGWFSDHLIVDFISLCVCW